MFLLVSIYVKTNCSGFVPTNSNNFLKLNQPREERVQFLFFPLLIRLELSSPYNFIDCSLLFFNTV